MIGRGASELRKKEAAEEEVVNILRKLTLYRVRAAMEVEVVQLLSQLAMLVNLVLAGPQIWLMLALGRM